MSESPAEPEIDEPMIERLVRAFYDRIRNDCVLGPIFAARVSDWEPHLQRMFAFWSSVTLRTGRYGGQPMAKHLPLPIDTAHFDRWLALFEDTAQAQCPPAAASRFIDHARRIAASLEMGVAAQRGEIRPSRLSSISGQKL
jgi:hemoglobin